MRVKFNFNLQAWVEDVEIEADSIEKAESKLYGMTVQELIEAGYIHTSDLNDVEATVMEKTVKVTAYDLEYIIEEDDFESTEEYIETINNLPTELTFEITVEPNDDIETLIADEITFITDWMVEHFNYVIVDEK